MVDLNNVNDDQKQAIIATEGPVLIIAGPGTGKTFTLVKRISYLISEKGVNPREIMVVTFTEKAAKELLTRISNDFIENGINININEMYIGTFHSVCLRLLKENAPNHDGNGGDRMLDAFEQTYLVCKNLENFNRLHGFAEQFPNRMGDWNQALEICRYVNQLREELVDIDAMLNDADEDMRLLAKLVCRYNELLDHEGAIDFSSIQTNTFRMLEQNEGILKRLRNTISYIMVDEYQDTNYVQEQIVLMLMGEKKNVCVVGDDDQGMYRFRGATIRNILEFPTHFAEGECKIVHLNNNYRSEPGIIDFYNKWMDGAEGINIFNWDKFRYPKKILPKKSEQLFTESVFKISCNGLEQEKETALEAVKNLKENGNISDYNQVAFLFKSVKSSEAIELGDYFEKNGIPIYSPRSDLFFERAEVKTLLGCIMLCFQSYLMDLKKNEFIHSISDELRQYYISCVKEANRYFKEDHFLHEYINTTSKEISGADDNYDQGLLDIYYRLLAYQPFTEALEANLQDGVYKTRPVRNLAEISRMIAKFNHLHDMHKISSRNKIAMPEEFFNIYMKYMFIDGIGEYEDDSEIAPKGCISFMTIHQSKGLEFPAVFVGSLGNVPKKESDPLMMTSEMRFFRRKQFEPYENIKFFDFWRLYYTAFSRAQNLLVLMSNKKSKYFDDFLINTKSINDFDEKEKFENVKSVQYKKVYSFTSHIAVYQGCPTQYKYYKEYAFAQNKMFHTSVGSLVHATLEDLNNCAIDGKYDEITESAIENWFEYNYKSMQEQTGYFLTEEQKTNALSQVIRYYHHRKDELGKVWKAEDEINLVLPDYILQGVIDLVEGDEDTVEIVDYKTGPKPNLDENPHAVDHYKTQLEIYAYLIEKRYGKKVSRMHLYYTSVLEGNPIISFDWKRKDIDSTITDVTETVSKIEAKEFKEKAQNNYACRFCDMKYVCKGV